MKITHYIYPSEIIKLLDEDEKQILVDKLSKKYLNNNQLLALAKEKLSVDYILNDININSIIKYLNNKGYEINKKHKEKEFPKLDLLPLGSFVEISNHLYPIYGDTISYNNNLLNTAEYNNDLTHKNNKKLNISAIYEIDFTWAKGNDGIIEYGDIISKKLIWKK